MPFINTKYPIECPHCGHINEILTLEPYNSGKSVQGSVSGTRYYRDQIPMRIASNGRCKKCDKSMKKAILEEFPGARFLG
jgi:phage FluMu protein Com